MNKNVAGEFQFPSVHSNENDVNFVRPPLSATNRHTAVNVLHPNHYGGMFAH